MKIFNQIKALSRKKNVRYAALALGAFYLYIKMAEKGRNILGMADAPDFASLTNPMPMGVLPNMPTASLVLETPTAEEAANADLLQAIGIG